jgi:hypothetical protein
MLTPQPRTWFFLAPTLALVATCGLTGAARAADMQLTLPALVAAPGSTVVVHLDVTPAPTGFNVLSLDFSMPLNPAVIQGASVLSDGFLQFWGPAFTNGTSTVVAGAAAGITPLTTTSTRLSTILLTLKATAVPGTVMPLAFSALRFNEGSPSVSVTPGSLTVVSGVDAPYSPPRTGFVLDAPHPNPTRGTLHVRLTLAERSEVRLSLHDLQGRAVGEVAGGELSAGAHDYVWADRDVNGHSLPAGLYLLRASGAGQVQVRRVVWVR